MGSLATDEDYGRRLLPHVVEKAAATRPDRVVYSFPFTDDPSDGFHHVTNRRYANGVNRLAWWIEASFGKTLPKSFPSIGYIGPNDLRYAMLTIAAVKVGYKMMFLSPRNSIDGHLAVIDSCDCKLWVLPAERLGHVDQVLEKRPMKITASMADLAGLLCEDAVNAYPYTKSFAEARQDPFVVLHTSGSTGLPKPVFVPHGSVATPDAHHLLLPIEGRFTQTQYFNNPCRAYSTFPNFHSAGMVFCCALPFFYELSIVFGPPLVPVSLDLVNSMLDHGKVDGSLLAPSILEEISKSPASLERIAKTSFTCFGGGPLSQQCGDIVNAVTRVFNIVGVTEGSLFPVVQAEREDWNYLHFHPGGGYTFRQRTEELWEQFQTRDSKLDLFQAFLQTFPNEDEIAIKDLYSKHPTKPGRWLYRGRTDDVIVLSNGEKVNPVDMEATLNSHPAVKASLVVGQGKFQTMALIQLHKSLPSTEEDIQIIKQSLWTTVEAANRQAPAHAQLHRDYILFAASEKPFLLAGKDTVLRAMTVKLYEAEIDDFYARQEQRQLSDTTTIDLMSIESLQQSLQSVLCEILDNPDLAPKDDFFIAGLDSLSVFKLLATIRASLQHTANLDLDSVKSSLIYSNSTVEKLSKAIDLLIRPAFRDQSTPTISQHMADLLEKYTRDLPQRNPAPPKSGVDGPSVILTGSTGSLGSYLLESLLSNEKIRHVFCINRAVDAQERHLRAKSARGLKQDLLSGRLRFFKADLSKPNFGLDGSSYDVLLAETTHIIHNQWQVDFNLTLSSFEPHIQGVRRLVDFAFESVLNPDIFFVSSVGVVKSQKTDSCVPEAQVTDFLGAEGGYGTSKLISELILAKAQAVSSVNCSICRLGQIAGPVELGMGMWNKQEWLPSIVASSKYLRMVPSTLSSLDRIDWLPVNHVSQIIVELAGLYENQRTNAPSADVKFFHGVNPSVTSWSSLLPAVRSYLGPEVSVVPWDKWLCALVESESRGDYAQNPGIKLLDFYRNCDEAAALGLSLPVLETKITQLNSQTLRNLGPVTEDWMAQWMKQWGF